MNNERKKQDARDWARLNVQITPAQYALLNTIKKDKDISLGEVSRIMFDIATCVLLDDYQKAKSIAQPIIINLPAVALDEQIKRLEKDT